jgi:hypothetical protein
VLESTGEDGARSIAQVASDNFYGKQALKASANASEDTPSSAWKKTQWGQTQAYKMREHARVKGHCLGVAMLLQASNESFRQSTAGWDLVDPTEVVINPPAKKRKRKGTSNGGKVHQRNNKPAVP